MSKEPPFLDEAACREFEAWYDAVYLPAMKRLSEAHPPMGYWSEVDVMMQEKLEPPEPLVSWQSRNVAPGVARIVYWLTYYPGLFSERGPFILDRFDISPASEVISREATA